MVSTAMGSSPKAFATTTAAVFDPTPGRVSSHSYLLELSRQTLRTNLLAQAHTAFALFF